MNKYKKKLKFYSRIQVLILNNGYTLLIEKAV